MDAGPLTSRGYDGIDVPIPTELPALTFTAKATPSAPTKRSPIDVVTPEINA